jgi:hypothetical protein
MKRIRFIATVIAMLFTGNIFAQTEIRTANELVAIGNDTTSFINRSPRISFISVQKKFEDCVT